MAVLKSVRVKMRISILESEIQMKGGHSNRPGREHGPQSKVVVDGPPLELTLQEYEQRKADAVRVLARGWQLVETEPVEIWMGDCLYDPANSLIAISGKVNGNNVATTCGFYVATDPEFSDAVLLAAAESPVTSHNDTKITYALDVSGLSNVTLYFRAYATDGVKTVYSITKTVQIPVIV